MTQMTRRIRKATPADAPIIWQLILELAEFEKLRSQVRGSLQQLQEKLFTEPASVEAIVCGVRSAANTPESIVGFALFFSNFSTFEANHGFYLEDLYVQPQHRGQGHGKAMLQWLARLARQRNFSRIDWAVLDWNHRAIEFYQGLGATVMNDWRLVRLDQQAIEKLEHQ